MSDLTAVARLEQRQALRSKLCLQRLRIEQLLAPQAAEGNQFPRSMTMRLVIQRPAVTMRLASKAARMLFGPRFICTLGGVLLLGKLLRSTSADQRQPPPSSADL